MVELICGRTLNGNNLCVACSLCSLCLQTFVLLSFLNANICTSVFFLFCVFLVSKLIRLLSYFKLLIRVFNTVLFVFINCFYTNVKLLKCCICVCYMSIKASYLLTCFARWVGFARLARCQFWAPGTVTRCVLEIRHCAQDAPLMLEIWLHTTGGPPVTAPFIIFDRHTFFLNLAPCRGWLRVK